MGKKDKENKEDLERVLDLRTSLVVEEAKTKEKMPDNVWSFLYAKRNGQIVEILSLKTEEDLINIRQEYSESYSGHSSYELKDGQIIKKNEDGSYSYKKTHNSSTYTEINSWGDLVEFAVARNLDLSGLVLSDAQKQYQYEFELQGKSLSSGRLDKAVFDHMNLSDTGFHKAKIRQASFKETTGKNIRFNNADAYLADFSGAKYVAPDFTEMKAARSNHFNSVYNIPIISETDWNSSHIVGTKFFVKKFDGYLELSGSLLAGSLFYGMGPEKVRTNLSFSHASFPGTCFYNVGIRAGGSYGRRGDFSPLSFNDPRLNTEEKAFISNVGQWLNSEQAMDGVKISPELTLNANSDKLFTMFSEVDFLEQNNIKKEVLFFSKGKVLDRQSFHEADLTEITDVLSDNLRENLLKVDGRVVENKKTNKDQEDNASIEFDQDRLDLQIKALKECSMVDAMSIGNALQKTLSEKANKISDWAYKSVDHTLSALENFDELHTLVKEYSLKKPEPVKPPEPDPIPEPELEPETKKKSRWQIFGGDEEEKTELPIPTKPQTGTKIFIAPEPDQFFEIGKMIEKLPDRVETSIKENTEFLRDVQSFRDDLRVLNEAFTSYVNELGKFIEEQDKSSLKEIIAVAKLRKASLEESSLVVSELDQKLASLMVGTVKGNLAIQEYQGKTAPDLYAHFKKASGIHKLAKELEKDPLSYQKDEHLSNLYNTLVDTLSMTDPNRQVTRSFNLITKSMRAILNETATDLKEAHKDQRASLNRILTPAPQV